ncbi:unnamed protein product [Cylindrotheca closterium]|uniref:Uncharacterized protein n=1 Tax=Cylindrotheca closterium TaxID=2856 RepID=A0AAD2FYD4_9STRA|nr:unnamed protein product [Cylindrotheca closterium]
MRAQKYMSDKQDFPTSLHLVDFHNLPTELHCTTVRTIHALNHAVAPAERSITLNHALHTFSHNNPNLHDYEMSLGVDKTLCSKLGFISSERPINEDEIILICKCLSQVYQCSMEYRKRSFWSVGASELFPLLAQLWNHFHSDLAHVMFQDSKKGVVLQQLVKAFRIFAKLDIANPCLVYFEEGRWLSSIISCIRTNFDQALESNDHDLLHEMLGLIKDLTFRSALPERKEMIGLEGGCLVRVLFMCCARKVTTTSKIKEALTAVMWNLALEKNTREVLLFREGRQTSIAIDFLLAVLTKNVIKTSTKESTTMLRAKRNAISAIGNIFADEQNHQFLCSSDHTKNGKKALRTLLKQVGKDCDSVVRRRAMRTIRCLTQSEDPEMRRVIRQEELVLLLVDSISRNISHDDENDRDMQLQALCAVGNMTDAFSETDWPLVETTILQRIETTTDPKLINGACKCLVECISKSPWSRGSSCFSEMFWMRLETAVSVSNDCHECVSTLILVLAGAENDKKDMETNKTSVLVSPFILKCVTKMLEADGDEYEKSRKRALDSIVALAENEANKRCMAENEDLLSGLVNLCLLQPQQPTRRLAKELILQLVPEL